MNNFIEGMRKIFLIFNYIRCFPHIILFYTHKNKSIIHADTLRWLEIEDKEYNKCKGFVYLLSFYPQFRNLFYYRIGPLKHLLKLICAPMSTLFIHSPQIGEGLYIQHGFSTIINAKSIGKNCWINQQVTIGFSRTNHRPTLLDNVTVYAGAKILGDISIGENAVIGANAVAIKDVPGNCTAVGVPARIIRINGQ